MLNCRLHGSLTLSHSALDDLSLISCNRQLTLALMRTFPDAHSTSEGQGGPTGSQHTLDPCHRTAKRVRTRRKPTLLTLLSSRPRAPRPSEDNVSPSRWSGAKTTRHLGEPSPTHTALPRDREGPRGPDTRSTRDTARPSGPGHAASLRLPFVFLAYSLLPSPCPVLLMASTAAFDDDRRRGARA